MAQSPSGGVSYAHMWVPPACVSQLGTTCTQPSLESRSASSSLTSGGMDLGKSLCRAGFQLEPI